MIDVYLDRIVWHSGEGPSEAHTEVESGTTAEMVNAAVAQVEAEEGHRILTVDSLSTPDAVLTYSHCQPGGDHGDL